MNSINENVKVIDKMIKIDAVNTIILEKRQSVF